MDGILNVYKEKGYTSHDVIARLRGILHQKRIGHTGTLDPMAEGVLPVCLGSATKLCDFLTDKEKTYEAQAVLGVSTDTLDATGEVMARAPREAVEAVTRERLEAVLPDFTGEIVQLPPMYSAVWVDGRRLYDLARHGETVERPERHVTVRQLELTGADLPAFTLKIRCGKGTYVRSLIADIGDALGVGACLTGLVRTQSGVFGIDTCARLSEVETAMADGSVGKMILPVDLPFSDCPAARVTTDDAEKLLRNGNPLRASALSGAPKDAPLVRVYEADGRFAAVYTWKKEKNRFMPVKMFLSE